jgi:transcriptional regulator with XRE-family HTH domain
MMLQQLIRQALSRKNMSMRKASLLAGHSESYVRDILDGSTRDPGITGLLELAEVLDIPPNALLEAVQKDRGHSKDRREAAARIISQMTPEELAAFIATHSTRRP